MTPEEEKRINDRFERIEQTLERMATESEIRFTQFNTHLDRMIVTTAVLDRAEAQHEKWRAEYEKRQAESEERLDHIARGCDFIVSSQASVWEALRHLVDAFDAHRKNPDGHGSEKQEES